MLQSLNEKAASFGNTGGHWQSEEDLDVIQPNAKLQLEFVFK